MQPVILHTRHVFVDMIIIIRAVTRSRHKTNKRRHKIALWLYYWRETSIDKVGNEVSYFTCVFEVDNLWTTSYRIDNQQD